MLSYAQPSARTQRVRGFTLVELLAVIVIISVLMTVAAIGVGGIMSGKGVTSGVATAESLFDEARSAAVSKRTRARVLIDIHDPKDRVNYLRRMLVVYEELDDDGNVMKDNWVLAGRAILLPEQTFFSQEFSRKDQATGAQLDQMTLSNVNRVFQGNYYYYEFNGEGISTNPGASFIIGTGARAVNGAKPQATESTKRDFGGLVVWRNGRTTAFRSPDQMGLPSEIRYF
jgi:prepilin-type N-terminal cleavage/methylation domain-containing protein